MNNFEDVQTVRQFKGTVLQDMYKVGRMLGEGSFGSVHKIKNLHGKDKYPMVVKASKDASMLHNEIKALDQIHEYMENNLDDISNEVANSFPINCGRGLLYLEKEA